MRCGVGTFCGGASLLYPAPPAPQELEERYRKGDIQGMISIEDPDCLAGLKERGVPAVVVNLERPQDQVHCRVDFRSVGRLAGMRLLAAGHRRIGVLSGDLSSFIYREMLAGFRGALAEEEIYPEAGMVIEAPLNRTERAYGSLVDLLRSSERPTAFFATRDHRAEMIWRACRELNLRIPEDLSVIGYDDISWPSAESQGLTTIRQPLDEMGHIALELLDEYFRTRHSSCQQNCQPQPDRAFQCRRVSAGAVPGVELCHTAFPGYTFLMVLSLSTIVAILCRIVHGALQNTPLPWMRE